MRIAVVTVTMGYRHECIPLAAEVIASLAPQALFFRTADDLKTFDASAFDLVMFVNTTGELPLPDRGAFVQWVRDGGAFVGVHSAADTFHAFPEYLEMVGG